MSWFRENKFLGWFLIVFSLATLISAGLLFIAKSGFDEASDQFNQTATELNRLQRLNPFPNNANLLTMKTQSTDYGVALGKLKDELRASVLPVTAMAPSEFQARLRQTWTAVFEKARANKVKLPGNFFLGFDEFASSLPSNEAAPLLGQQLAQVKLLADILIDARIDAVTAFRRGPLPKEHGAALTPSPSPSRGGKTPGVQPTGPILIERSTVEATFASTPTAARRVLNQIASANKQFFIIRTLHVMNEKDKGPLRAVGLQSANPETVAPGASPGAKPGALTFIVGTEHIQTSVSIELIKFIF